MLGNLSVKLDRKRQVVIITQDNEIKEFTYEQLAGLFEQLFPAET